MLYTGKLWRAELYNDNTYPYTNVKAVYEANKDRFPGKKLIVTNGHWYSASKPVGNYKVGGVVLSKEWGSALGFGWDNDSSISMDWFDMATVDNFVGTIPMIHNGVLQQKEIDLNKNSSVGRSCLRTWWGFDRDGNCTIEVTTTNYTIQQIADRMLSLGIHNGLVLDGSGSSQCYDGVTHQQGDGRRLYGFVLLWFEEEDSPGTGETGQSLSQPVADSSLCTREPDKEGESPSLAIGETAPFDKGANKEGEIKMFKLALDAGHGMYTAGKRCMKALDPNETREWYLNDRIADLVEEKLTEYEGIEVLRTDDTTGVTDVTLGTRTKMANDFGADFFLSIHHNAGINGGSGGGITAFSYYSSSAGADWRNELYEKLIEHTGLRGDRSQPLQTAGFDVLAYTAMPAVLLELGFMDSRTDVPIILGESFPEECAEAIAEVIARRAGLKKKAQEAPETPEALSLEQRVERLEKKVFG